MPHREVQGTERSPYLASKDYRRCHRCTQLLQQVVKQYKVAEGDVIRVEKLGVEAGETVTFDNVIAVSNDGLKAGEDVKDASVTATVVENGKAKKSYRLQVQEKIWIPQEKRSQTAVH